MQKILLVFLFCHALNTVGAQCLYEWEEYDNMAKTKVSRVTSSDTLLTGIFGPAVDFNAVISKVNNPVFSSTYIEHIRQQIDSLRSINKPQASQLAVDLYSTLQNTTQVITHDSMQYGLHTIDTIVAGKQPVLLYKFTTSFSKYWMPYFPVFTIYYTPSYGVVSISHESIPWQYPSKRTHNLIKNCRHTPKDVELISNLTTFIGFIRN